MKTDNSYFDVKVQLRVRSLPRKNEIYVLDCFSGTGKIWKEVCRRESEKNIHVISIEKEEGKNRYAITGDNIKVLSAIDLKIFDIIDLDSYGIPFSQMEILFRKGYKGIVHITAIQSGMGKLPNGLLIKLGYTRNMIKKIPTIFNRNGIEKIKNYLYLYDIEHITGCFIDRKNYFYFKTN